MPFPKIALLKITGFKSHFLEIRARKAYDDLDRPV